MTEIPVSLVTEEMVTRAYAAFMQNVTAVTPKGSVTGIQTLSITGLVWAVLRRYGNINPLSIDYACRPRLRSRLTQGRLA